MIKLNNKIQIFLLLSTIFLVGCGSDGGYKEAFRHNPNYPLRRDIRHVKKGWGNFWYRQTLRKQCYEDMQQDVWNFIME